MNDMIASKRAPNIMRADYRLIKSSDAERVMQIENEFRNAVTVSEKDLSDSYKCWRAYFAVDGGQWPEQELSELRRQDRHPYTFDVVGPKLDTLAGTIVSDLPDQSWKPTGNARTAVTDAIETTYDSDKEVCNWEIAMAHVIRDGLVHGGWAKLGETKKYDPLGNLFLERCLPGYIVPSPYWKSENDRDLKDLWEVGYFLPEGLKYKYHAKHDQIEEAIEQRKRSGRTYPYDGHYRRLQYETRVGEELQVIEYHWLEIVETKRLVGMQEGSDGVWLPFPVTKDRGELELFASHNNIDWETVAETPYTDMIHRVDTICPELDRTLLLASGKARTQVRGLPYYHFTVLRHAGRSKGLMISMLDLAYTVNFRENLVNQIIEKTNGGLTLLNENLTNDAQQRRRIKKNLNKPGHSEFVNMDDVQKSHERIGPADYQSAVLEQTNRMFDKFLPFISRVSDSMSAISDSGKSGILFEREYQVNRIGNVLIDKNVKQMLNNIGEGYFEQWKITYGDAERTIANSDGKSITLNERIIMPDGAIGIRNAVKMTPRVTVIVTESTKSKTYQSRYRQIFAEMLNNVPEDMHLFRSILFTSLMETIQMPEKQQQMIKAAIPFVLTKAQMQFVAEITTLKAQMDQNALTSAQAQSMLMQFAQGQEVQENIVPQSQMGEMPEQGESPPVAMPQEDQYAMSQTGELGI